MADAARKRIVRVLAEDPDLGEALDQARFEHAAHRAVAPLLELPSGRWRRVTKPSKPVFGLLLLSGVVGNRVVISERSHLELLGPGDVVRPWVGFGPDASTATGVNWWTFGAAQACMLDARFCLAIMELPEIYEALVERLVVRALRLNFQLALNALVGVEERTLLTLWHFADRWGRVTPEGVTLPFPLTHADIADMIGARRPSVTSALMRLRKRREIEPCHQGWLLCGSRPARLRELEERVALADA